MEFEWDEGKAASNIAKHGVPFAIVREFDWIGAVAVPDTRFDYGEFRYVAYGPALDGNGYVVAFTFRGNVRRIISVRPFGRKEYEIHGK